MKPFQHKLIILGIGEDFADKNSNYLLAPSDDIKQAEYIFGSKRQLGLFEEYWQSQLKNLNCPILHDWHGNIEKSMSNIEELAIEGKKIIILASGDPNHYGLGPRFADHFGLDNVRIIASPSSIALAAAELGWPLQYCQIFSIHGRPSNILRGKASPKARWIVLCHNRESPKIIAQHLAEDGFGKSILHIMMHLGHPKKMQKKSVIAHELLQENNDAQFDDLAIIAVELQADDPSCKWLPKHAGLSNDHYMHDGQITRSVIRAASMAALKPAAGHILWDIGAGSGAVSIEWARLDGHAIAIEPNQKRIENIRLNAEIMGVAIWDNQARKKFPYLWQSGLEIINGKAPAIFEDLLHRQYGSQSNITMRPDAIFIGGGLSQNKDILLQSYDILPDGGRLVAHAVTLVAQQILAEFYEQYKSKNIELLSISLEDYKLVNHLTMAEPAKRILQLTVLKC